MKIQQFSQLGKRGNNEDSLGRNEALLTVCDGMGGHNYGERASAFVVEHLLEAFAELQPLGKTEIQQQLTKVQTDLNGLLEKEPELERMGTTFTGILRTPDVWYAAHIGDSRIYLFRPAERKLWHTWDHSLVGELMRTHEITVEAGRFHPLSNRISKAIIAQTEGKTAMASIVKIDELKAGDILLLCSDGVVESWGDWDLVQLFADEKMSFEQKCQKLAQQCDGNSKDNNTAIIAEIEAADGLILGSPVYYGSVTAQLKTFMDRIGLLGEAHGRSLRGKIGGSVSVARRWGHLSVQAELMLWFDRVEMVHVGCGWCSATSTDANDISSDAEGATYPERLADNISLLIRGAGH